MSNILIYTSHKFQNDERNKAEVEDIIRNLVKEEPQHTYINPIACFGYLYNDVPYQQGLDMCLKLLSRCDCMYVTGEIEGSQGVKAEIRYCREHAIPYEVR